MKQIKFQGLLVFIFILKNAFGQTGCIPDAMCYNDWQNECEAVARIVVGGFGGTGTLINNEAQDRRPFFLTALHVVDLNDDGNIDQAEINALATAQFQFDFRNNSCNGTLVTTNTRTGAILRAFNPQTDMALLELSQEIPLAWVATYAGWTRNSGTPNYITVIHHPHGNPQRLSYSGLYGVQNHPFSSNYWQVTNWALGVVTPGSSGSALFNQYHQIVGQLKGGASSCTYVDFNDRFGKFHISWDNNPNANSQLRAWLSPNQNLFDMSHLIPLRIDGAKEVCYGQNTVINMPNLRPNETVSWSASGNLQIVSSTIHSVTVTPTSAGSGGMGTVTAQVSQPGQPNPGPVVHNIHVGAPLSSDIILHNTTTSSQANNFGTIGICSNTSNSLYISSNQSNLTNASWSFPGGWSSWTSGINATVTPSGYGSTIYVTAANQCGYASSPAAFFVNMFSCGSYYQYSITPNPAKDFITINFEVSEEEKNFPEKFELYNETNGSKVLEINTESKEQIATLKSNRRLIINVANLSRGKYILRSTQHFAKQEDKFKSAHIILD